MPWRDSVAESDNCAFLQSPNGAFVDPPGGIPDSSTPSHRRRSEISDRCARLAVWALLLAGATGRGRRQSRRDSLD